MDDDYSTDLLLASLLNDNIDDSDTVHSSPQVSANQLSKSPSGSTQQNSIINPISDDHFDSLEDLLNATLSPSEESYSDLDKTTSDNTSVSIPVSVTNATPPEVSKTSTTAVGLPPKFRNTFRPVEVCDTATTTIHEFRQTTFNSPSYVVASQASTNSNNVITDGRLTTSSSENTWRQLKNKTWNNSVCPPSKRFCSEDHMSSYNKLVPSVTTVTPSSVNTTTSLSGNDVHSNLLARTESNVMTQQHQQVSNHSVASTTSVSLNGVNSTANNVTTTANNAATIDLKRLQETNLVSELQAASTKPISSASIVHAIQVVQLNYGMLLQKLSQNLDDATAQEVKTKLMVLTHHYKQLVQQYQAKLSAEKTGQLSSNVPTTTGRVVTTNTTAIGSVTNYASNHQSSTSNMSLVAATTPSTVIDLTHDKSIKTTPTNTATKESCVTVTAPQHLTSTTATASAVGANVSSYLQSIPSLAAYLLQNTEAQKQLTPMELQQLNQIRVNLLQEFQRRQVQNFLTSLPADARPKNVNELKDMMKEKNFSIQIPPFLVAPVMKPSVSTTQFKQEMKSDPLMNFADNKQMAMQAGSLSGHQQSVMATLLPHTMVNNVKSDELPTSYQQDVKPPVLPGDVKSLTVTTQPQLFIGDMLQHLHSSQIAAAAAGAVKLTTPIVSSLKSDIKREDTSTVSYATSQFLQGGGTSAAQANNLLKNSTHRSYSNAVNPPSYSRSKIMADNITRNIPGTSFSSKAAKYRAMAANVSSVADVSSLSTSSSITKSSLYHSTSNSLTHSNSVSSSSTHYNTRAQLRTQRMMEEQKRLEEERIKQLTYTPEQLKTISNIKYFMQADHSRITKVDTQTPFHSKQDAFQRLSAYHVYYEPEPSEAIESRVEQMHDILARELMKKSRGLMAKYNQLLLRDEQKEVPKHIELANERLFVEGELHKEYQQKEDSSAVQKSVTPVLDATAMSKLSSLGSQLIHDINVLHYTNTAGSVGIT